MRPPPVAGAPRRPDAGARTTPPRRPSRRSRRCRARPRAQGARRRAGAPPAPRAARARAARGRRRCARSACGSRLGSSSAPQSSIGIDTNAGPAGASSRGGSPARARTARRRRAAARSPLDVRACGTSTASRFVRFACIVIKRARLLAGRDEQRRLVGARVEDRADAVADAGRRVQVDVRDAPARLREPVRHAHRHRLLQAEHVAEVIGERTEHRQLGRARVAEDRRHPARAEQLERRFADRRHGVPLWSVVAGALRGRAPAESRLHALAQTALHERLARLARERGELSALALLKRAVVPARASLEPLEAGRQARHGRFLRRRRREPERVQRVRGHVGLERPELR